MLEVRLYIQFYLLFICFALAGSINVFAQNSESIAFSEKTDTVYLKEMLDFLGSNDLKGRLPGTQEYDIAAEFVENEFKRHGLSYLPEIGSYRQDMKIWQNLFIEACDFEILHFSDGRIQPNHGTSYNFRGYTGSGKMQLETVFCGYGVDLETYSDYADIDVNGKAVLIFKGNPSFRPENYEFFSISGRAATAKEKGAAAVIFLNPLGAGRAATIGSVMFGDGEYISDLPLIQIDDMTAEILFDGSGISPLEILQSINNNQEPSSFALKSEISVNVKTEFRTDANSYNIVGFIEGANPKFNSEYLIITAHLDHVGYQCDVIYPGTNDNASGSAAVIELARLFSENKPARSIIFILLTGEEQGLIGAKHFVDNLTVDKEKITAVFNFDCIAVGDSIQLGSGLSNPKLYSLAISKDSEGIVISNTWKGGGADLTPFYEAGIPGLYVVTRYSYTHLHLPTDTPSTLNIPLLEKVINLGYNVIKEVANGNYNREEVVK